MIDNQATQLSEPFVGTRPFETGEPIFGRDREVEELSNRLLARRIVLLHALSGAGKTSLIQAGLIPILEKKGFQVLPTIRFDKQPPDDRPYNRYLYSMLASLGEELPPVLPGSAAPPKIKLAERLAVLAETAPGKSATRGTLLIFDQFEEILSLDISNPQEKEAFFAQLLPVLYDVRYSAIFSMREDYLAELEPYLAYFPDRLSARFRLEFFKQDAAVEAIREPASAFGVDFKEEAAQKLVDDLRQVLVWRAGSVQKKPGLYIEPMHLQVVCRRLWEAGRPDPRQVSLSDVETWGNVDDALCDYYNEKVADVAVRAGKREQDLRDWIEFSLITGQGLRGNVREGQESEFDLDSNALNLLTQTHLVRREERRETVWYELAHDRLVEPVHQANAAWREKLNKLQRNARPWKLRGEPKDLLLSGPDLFEAEAWADSHRTELAPIEAAYLKASRLAYHSARSEHTARAELGLNLEETGWGVIFPAGADPALREALKELLDHRREQASRVRNDYFKEFSGVNGYRQGETSQQFLARFGAGYGPANPEKVPYYLLIVGDPQTIPFEFQYNLDVQYAVGRIFFETLEEYQSYARSVLLSESANVWLPGHAVFFGTEHDRATRVSLKELVHPLVAALQQVQPNWRIEPILSTEATKERLVRLLESDRAPAFLFTATHARRLESGHPQQMSYQGALLCQDWPGLEQWQGEIPHDFYLAEEDISDDARLLGLVAFLWGSFTAGTPRMSDVPRFGVHAGELAPQAFLSRLPQRLLGHPRGGALAVIGIVEEGWTTSFLTLEGGSDLGAFINALDWLMQGYTVGKAMEVFNRRYTVFSSLLAEELRLVTFYGKERDDRLLQRMLTQTIDARNYLLIGDPAARLPVKPDEPYQEPEPDWARPAIEAVRSIAAKPATKAVTLPLRDVAPAITERSPAQTNLLAFNGLNAVTGDYMFPPVSAEELAQAIRGESIQSEHLLELRAYRYRSSSKATF